MSFANVQVKRLKRAGCTNAVIGKCAIKAALPTDEFDRKVAKQCAKENGWEIRGNSVFALLEESAEYLLNSQEALKAEQADGYYTNSELLVAVNAMMSIFGDAAKRDRGASPLGWMAELA